MASLCLETWSQAEMEMTMPCLKVRNSKVRNSQGTQNPAKSRKRTQYEMDEGARGRHSSQPSQARWRTSYARQQRPGDRGETGSVGVGELPGRPKMDLLRDNSYTPRLHSCIAPIQLLPNALSRPTTGGFFCVENFVWRARVCTSPLFPRGISESLSPCRLHLMKHGPVLQLARHP